MKTFNLFNSNKSTNQSGVRSARTHLPRLAAIFTFLLTFSVGQMWGITFSGGYVYFDNTNTNWSGVFETVAHQYTDHDYIGCSTMSLISGTNNLYYVANPAGTNWGGIWGWRIMCNAGAWGSQNSSEANLKKYATHYTASDNSNGITSGYSYLCYGANSNKDCAFTRTSLGNSTTQYESLNYTQTLNQTLSTDGGSTFSASTASIATVTVSANKLNGRNSTTSSSGTIGTGKSSTSCSAARTATVTYSVSSVATGYEFVGWYDGSTQKSTSTSYTYNATEAKTITARFKETQYSLTFSHNGHGSIAVGGNTVSSGSTANVNYFTTMTLVATPSTGYNFSGWTKSGSNTGSVTIGNESNASTTIKATNTGATVTAGFTPQTYNITYKDEGNVAFSGVHGDGYPTTHTYGTATALVSPTKDHYTFAGWYTNSACTLSAGSSIGATAKTADFTLYAKWTEITHDVRANTNTHATTSPNSWTPFGEVTGGTVSATSISTGYRFNGWSASTGTFADASSATTTFYPTTNNTYVTASIVAKTYSITLNKNGGDSDGSATATYASSTIGGFSAASRAGYSTDGYYTDPSAGVKILNSDGTLVTYSASVSSYVNTSDQWKYDDNITLYPHWTENATYYTLHYTYGTGLSSYFSSISATKTSGGDAVADNASLVSGTGVTLTATPADHYRFVGWYSAAGCTANTLVSTNNPYGFSMSANTNLYAKAELMTTAITLDANGGAGGTTSVTATHGSRDLSSSIIKPTRSGYDLQGWFTEESGGTKVILSTGYTAGSASGYTDASGYWTYTGTALTLYAHWTAKTYKVTFDKQSGAGGSDNVTATYNAAMPSATMPTRTGYDFNGYYGSTGGSGTKYYNSDASSAHVWDVASATTIYAYWTIHNYDITYSPSSAPTGCTYTTKPTSADYNTTVDMVITPSTGYTVSVSAVDASSNVVTVTPGANNHYTFTQPASAVTVSVTATETMSSLSTSCHYDAGNPSYAAPAVAGSATTVGYATTRSITAASASTGYRFVGWTLTNCTRTDGGVATANPITVRSNGDGAAASVQANYEEVLTSTWYVEGDASGPFLGWKADATTMLQKKTGYSTSNDVYWTATVTAAQASPSDTQWEFKIYNSAGANETAKWYGWGTGDNYYWLTSENKSLTLSNSTNNVRFKPYLAGDYEFHFNTSTKVLTVTWPVYNQVRISSVSPTADATNVGSFDLSAPVSNVRTVTRSLKANNTYTFKVVYNSDWYGYDSGTFTRSTSTSSNERTISNSGGDMTLTTDYAGDYTFKFNESTKALSVDFPEAYKVTYGKGTVDGSTGSCSAKDIDNGNAAVTSNSTWVKSGNRVVLTAPAAKTGYTYNGWFDNNSGTGDAITTNANCTITVSSALTRYACYTINNHAITHSASSHGSYTIKVGDASAVSTNTTSDYGKTITLAATPATGYHFGSWSAYKTGTPATTITVTSNQFTMPDYAVTVGATFTPNTYTVQFHRNGASEATVYQNFTYDVAQNLTANTYTRTGYNFAGWATSTSGEVVYDDGEEVSNLTSENGATFHLYAKWTAKNYTVTLDKQSSATGYKSGGTWSNPSVTYDATPSTVTGTAPAAKDGYAFMGFYTETNGGGLQIIDKSGAWQASKEGYTNASTHWIHDGAVTLYAYYQQSEITALNFVQGIVAPSSTVQVTPVLEPAPEGDTHIEWRVLYDNGNPLDPQPEMTTYNTNGKQFKSSEASGSYKVEAKLYTGTSGGTLLSTKVSSFQVAGNHTITVKYMSGSYVIQPATTAPGLPLDWTSITAPTLTGYTFTGWVAGDGITIETPDPLHPEAIQYKASYDGTLTAEYAKKSMIYFNNTLGWEHVYVYFYTGTYWSDTYGSGANYDQPFSGSKTHYRHFWGEMTQIEGTNIWYWDYQAEARSIDPTYGSEIDNNSSYFTVSFTKDGQGYPNGDDEKGYQWFYNTEAVYRGDFKHEMPMYVPIPEATKEYNKSGSIATTYYTEGYWMNYPESTGYELKVYDNKTDGAEKKSIPFEFNADKTMPMSVKLDLEAGKTYGFMIHRIDGYNEGDGSWYGNGGTMTATTTGWDMKTGKGRCGLSTTAAGDYEFILNYFAVNDDYQYRVTVNYPIAVGDYRVLYKDDIHTAFKPSAVIPQAALKDTVSFFVRKDKHPQLKLQKCSALGDKSVTWSDTIDNLITTLPAAITKDSVYNFCFGKGDANKLVLENTEGYSGNFYIRSDVAGTTKWDNYKASDHLMQYSDYADSNEDFTHYFVKYVERGTNIKFVIANDYSPCISDTLIADDTNFNNMDAAGTLKNDGNPDPTYDVNSANIRFMWNAKTNVVSRAYIGGSAVDRFLVLIGDSKLYNESGTAFPNNETKFTDDENFIYEVTIKANPTARAKLTAEYKGIVQYFKGNATAGALDENNSVEILGGTYDSDTKEKMRIVYDFKTNRLVCAWLPSDTEISGELDINADVMIIREHQLEAQQITFASAGNKLTDVKSVYGVMRFNRWTLANKDKSTHTALAPGDQKSVYERRMYFISFPFDVNLGDIFGLGRYDDHWWIQYYDGAERAEKGFFAESSGFWKFLENTKDAKLNANEGYILTLGSEMLNSGNTDIWTNDINQVELFFPSAGLVNTIEKKDATVNLTELSCSLNTNPNGSKNPGDPGYVAEKDRRIRDSHWHCIGVPSYANYSTRLKDAEGNDISWSTWSSSSFPFLYVWNMQDNTLTPTATGAYGFKTMNAYMVQAYGDIVWKTTSVPNAIAARRNANYKSSYMFRLDLMQDGKEAGRTFVSLRDDEAVTPNFDFNFDLSNEGGAIYTTTNDLVTVAGNCLPLETESVTTVPVGVVIKSNGEYTFAMPDGTEGLSVTLLDSETGVHTDLSVEDYTVELTAGKYEGRFFLSIDPRNAATMIDIVGGEGDDVVTAKILRNGILYIQRGDRLYDATGREIE